MAKKKTDDITKFISDFIKGLEEGAMAGPNMFKEVKKLYDKKKEVKKKASGGSVKGRPAKRSAENS